MFSCLYEGRVFHRRLVPVEHRFEYSLFLVYLDLSELGNLFRRNWFWSIGERNLASFHRADYYGDAAIPLDEAVRDLVLERTGHRPGGPIRLLTNLRYFGFLINPVSFYFCFDEQSERVESIVAEVTNSPWNERHCYVLDLREQDLSGGQKLFEYQNAKEFHVSPFMEMSQEYSWKVTEPKDQLLVQIESQDETGKLFEASLNMKRVPMKSVALSRMLVKYPMMTGRIASAIYWQALRLWWKKVPFVPHPDKGQAPSVIENLKS